MCYCMEATPRTVPSDGGIKRMDNEQRQCKIVQQIVDAKEKPRHCAYAAVTAIGRQSTHAGTWSTGRIGWEQAEGEREIREKVKPDNE